MSHIRDIDSVLKANLRRLPKLEAALQKKPDWLCTLSTDAGVREFEEHHGLKLPDDLIDYFASTWVSCFLHAYWEVDTYLEDLDALDESLPPVVHWSGEPHIVVGYLVHADCVCAANVDPKSPLINWGSFDQSFNYEPQVFYQWVGGAVQRQLGK